MKKTLCYSLPEAKISLEQTGLDRFTVTYFLQVKDQLNYSQAAHELGACIMHHLACEGKLDNRERGSRY